MSAQTRGTGRQSSSEEKGLGLLVDHKFPISALAPKKVKGILCYIRISKARRLRVVMLSLYSALVRLDLECCVRFWAPQDKRDMELLDQLQPGVRNMKSLLQGKVERAVTVQPQEEMT